MLCSEKRNAKHSGQTIYQVNNLSEKRSKTVMSSTFSHIADINYLVLLHAFLLLALLHGLLHSFLQAVAHSALHWHLPVFTHSALHSLVHSVLQHSVLQVSALQHPFLSPCVCADTCGMLRATTRATAERRANTFFVFISYVFYKFRLFTLL